MTVDPASVAPADFYRLLIGAVVPRPIAFVSTVSADGVRNLAPFSFFTVASANPPVLCFTVSVPAHPRAGGLTRKDTLANVEATREFVVNIVPEDLAVPMNLCSGDYPPDIDEFAVSGLTPIESEAVRPPRAAESPVQFECRLLATIPVSAAPMGGTLVLGQVVRAHIRDAVLTARRIDPDKLRAVGRMGGNSYTRTRDRFDLERPR